MALESSSPREKIATMMAIIIRVPHPNDIVGPPGSCLYHGTLAGGPTSIAFPQCRQGNMFCSAWVANSTTVPANDAVHRTAANDVDFRILATRGSGATDCYAAFVTSRWTQCAFASMFRIRHGGPLLRSWAIGTPRCAKNHQLDEP